MRNIKKLKSEAKRIFTRYINHLSKFDCGGALAEHISPDLQKDKERFNTIMIELETIDPSCPKGIRL